MARRSSTSASSARSTCSRSCRKAKAWARCSSASARAPDMSHTLMALVQDHPGVLHRVISLFRRRGYNIESLTVGRSEIPDVSRMTLVVDAENVEQVTKQLNRLIEVLKVQDVTDDRTVERETALVKVHAPAASRAGLIALT